MLICDQYAAVRAVAGALPDRFKNERLVMAPSHWWLLLRAEARLRDPVDQSAGQLSRLMSGLSPGAHEELVAPRGDVFEVLDFREYAATAAEVAQELNCNRLLADLVGAAIHNQAALCFGSAQNIPPVVESGLGGQRLVRCVVLQ